MTDYFNELKSELSKVTWPKKEETIRLTMVIFLVSGIFGALIGVMDFSFVKLLEAILAR